MGAGTSSDPTITLTQGPMDLSDVYITYDQIVLDSALQTQYQEKLLTSVIPIPMKCWHNSMFSLTGEANETTVAFTRSVSRLCTVWVTFFSVSSVPGSHKPVNYFPSVQGLVDSGSDTRHPLSIAGDIIPDTAGYALEYQFSIDGQRFPSVPIKTTTAAYASAVKALGLLGQTSHSLGIPGSQWASKNYVLVYDFERVPPPPRPVRFLLEFAGA